MKILIIDDDKIDRESVRRAITGSFPERPQIEMAETGEEGCRALQSTAFDCVFIDYLLPDLDGLDVLKRVYDPKTELAACPVIMLTGQGSENVMIEALHYGAQEYLVKDHISPETLGIAIRKAREIFDLKNERNSAEEKLVQSQKMEAVGQLTGGIAHDFNNLLTAIFGNTRSLKRLVKKKETEEDAFLEKIDAIHQSARRGAELVQRLMVFSRQRTLEPVTVDLNDLIEGLHELLSSSLGETIDIQMDLQNDLWPIDIDPGQIEHAIINMGVNARDAMPDGGVLKIQTKTLCLDEDTEHLNAGDYAVLTISDTGQGIDKTIQKKIFEPFFTTKETGKGTGLGLSMVYGLIKDSGGYIQLESEAGKGTSFHIYLPKSEGIVHESMPEQDIEEVAGGTETILVIEDEDKIRAITTDLLRSKGYDVLEADNGPNALDVVMDTDKHIDLIFTDIAMPGGMSGIQLAARVLAVKTDMQVLFTTGYTKESLPDYSLVEGQYHFLPKPYEDENVLRSIRKLLDEKKAA